MDPDIGQVEGQVDQQEAVSWVGESGPTADLPSAAIADFDPEPAAILASGLMRAERNDST